MDTKKAVISVVGMMLGSALGTFAYKSCSDDAATADAPTFDQALAQVASEMNKTCPMMVDSDTRLDGTMGGPGTVFTYRFTMVNASREEIDLPYFRQMVHPRIIANYRSQPEMRRFRENNVELHYQYTDKNGIFVTEFVVTPKDFGGPPQTLPETN